MKKRGYCFAGLTIDDMNPENIALKNDFNHNLHLIFMSFAPVLANKFSKVKVLKGMKSYKEASRNGEPSWINKKHSSGEAFEVTYEGFNREYVIATFSIALDQIEESYSVMINDNSFTVYKSAKREIVEEIDNKIRVIFS